MMLTDRELLEAAAKAAGFSGRWDPLVFFRVETKNGLWRMWNPLADDGDALRLAVKLEIHITSDDRHAWASTLGNHAVEPMGSDPYAATRRAIVRAAAAMAKP